jgi:hypothetical protein
MSDRTMPPVTTAAPPARLEPDAISVAQDTLIGLADTGPTVSIAFSLVLLIAATAYAAPLILLITAIPIGWSRARPDSRSAVEGEQRPPRRPAS